MRDFALTVVIGFLLTVAGRYASGAPEPPPSPVEAARPAKPAPRVTRVVHRPGPVATTTERPPDLVRLDALIGHLYGDPTPWDSDEARVAAERQYTDAADALERTGQGRMIRLDCASYPCLALIESRVAMGLMQEAVGEHLEGLYVYAALPVPEDPGIQRYVLEQRVEDIDPNDVHQLGRKFDLEIEANLPPVAPDAAVATRPLPWPP